MKKLLMAVALLGVAGCSLTNPPTSPGAVSEQTKVDEQVMVGFELSYKFARIALETALDAGRIREADKPLWREHNRRAYAALVKLRAGYNAANADSFTQAISIFEQLNAKPGE